MFSKKAVAGTDTVLWYIAKIKETIAPSSSISCIGDKGRLLSSSWARFDHLNLDEVFWLDGKKCHFCNRCDHLNV